MKRFLTRVSLFLGLTIIIFIMGASLPNEMVVNESLLGALPDKQSRLDELQSPKIVFVGGSNVSFGMDTQRIAEQFQCDAYNTSLHAGLGLKFMLDSSLPFIQRGDTVVVMPEYAHFVDAFYGNRELAAVVCDVYPEARRSLSIGQTLSLLPEIVSYTADKMWSSVALINRSKPATLYGRESFNAFGDATAHWGKAPEAIVDLPGMNSVPDLDNHAFDALVNYRAAVKEAGGHFVLLPPALKARSFNNQTLLIDAVKESLQTHGIEFDSECTRYRFEDRLFFNTPYHLLKEGVDLRTSRVIEDLERIRSSTGPTH